jgi:hypothetical protein
LTTSISPLLVDRLGLPAYYLFSYLFTGTELVVTECI